MRRGRACPFIAVAMALGACGETASPLDVVPDEGGALHEASAAESGSDVDQEQLSDAPETGPERVAKLRVIEPVPEHLAAAAAHPGFALQCWIDLMTKDGSVAVGTSNLSLREDAGPSDADMGAPDLQVFRWTEATGTVALRLPGDAGGRGDSLPSFMSEDGSIVVVWSSSDSDSLLWTPTTGSSRLTDKDRTSMFVTAGTPNGTVLVGLFVGADQVLRWSMGEGFRLWERPPGYYFGEPNAVSDDGVTVVGTAYDDYGGLAKSAEPFRWTSAGVALLGKLPGYDLCTVGRELASRDGKVAAGECHRSSNPSKTQTFRWTETGGITSIGAVDVNVLKHPLQMTRDGSVIAGTSTDDAVHSMGFVWSESSGMVSLALPGHTTWCADRGLSDDGTVVAGSSMDDAGRREAFRWTSALGMAGLGFLPSHDESSAIAISADGSVIVGWSSSGADRQAVYWDEHGKIHAIGNDLLEAGVELGGHKLLSATTVSVDRGTKVIAGMGSGPRADVSWIAWLP